MYVITTFSLPIVSILNYIYEKAPLASAADMVGERLRKTYWQYNIRRSLK